MNIYKPEFTWEQVSNTHIAESIIRRVSAEMSNILESKWGPYNNLRYGIMQRVKFLVERWDISLVEVENIARMDNSNLLDLMGKYPLTDSEYPLW